MLVEQIIKDTLELQGFRIVSIEKTILGLTVQLDADLRFKPWCDVCGNKAAYRDTRKVRCFRHVPLWGIPVTLRYAPRRVICSTCGGIHREALPYGVDARPTC